MFKVILKFKNIFVLSFFVTLVFFASGCLETETYNDDYIVDVVEPDKTEESGTNSLEDLFDEYTSDDELVEADEQKAELPVSENESDDEDETIVSVEQQKDDTQDDISNPKKEDVSSASVIVADSTKNEETPPASSINTDTNEKENTTPEPSDNQVSMVWIPTNGGKKYHSKSTCSKMIDPDYVALSEAEQLGFTPCGRCY